MKLSRGGHVACTLAIRYLSRSARIVDLAHFLFLEKKGDLSFHLCALSTREKRQVTRLLA